MLNAWEQYFDHFNSDINAWVHFKMSLANLKLNLSHYTRRLKVIFFTLSFAVEFDKELQFCYLLVTVNQLKHFKYLSVKKCRAYNISSVAFSAYKINFVC